MTGPTRQDAEDIAIRADQECASADTLVQVAERRMSQERRKTGRPAGRRAIDQPAHAWSTAQLASWIGMSQGFILTEINCGEITASNFGGSYRIHTTEVRRYLEAKGFPRPAWMEGAA